MKRDEAYYFLKEKGYGSNGKIKGNEVRKLLNEFVKRENKPTVKIILQDAKRTKEVQQNSFDLLISNRLYAKIGENYHLIKKIKGKKYPYFVLENGQYLSVSKWINHLYTY